MLNADDALCVAMAAKLRYRVEILYFSLDADNPVLLRHLEQGGRAAYEQDNALILADGTRRLELLRSINLPVSLSGHARYNIANALAAAAALLAADFNHEQITSGLSTFVSDGRTNPLRSNVYDVRGVTVIVDYAHNPAAYAALAETANSMSRSRLIAIVTAAGDRRDADLQEIGRTCARGFDELIVYESDARGRLPNETTRHILEGAREAGCEDRYVSAIPAVRDAVRAGLDKCSSGDVLVFSCAKTLADLVEVLRLSDPESAEKIAAFMV